MNINIKKLKQEFLDIIDDFYGLPDEIQSMDLYFRIDHAIAGSKIEPNLLKNQNIKSKKKKPKKHGGK